VKICVRRANGKFKPLNRQATSVNWCNLRQWLSFHIGQLFQFGTISLGHIQSENWSSPWIKTSWAFSLRSSTSCSSERFLRQLIMPVEHFVIRQGIKAFNSAWNRCKLRKMFSCWDEVENFAWTFLWIYETLMHNMTPQNETIKSQTNVNFT
jgi:hypothetical protein